MKIRMYTNAHGWQGATLSVSGFRRKNGHIDISLKCTNKRGEAVTLILRGRTVYELSNNIVDLFEECTLSLKGEGS